MTIQCVDLPEFTSADYAGIIDGEPDPFETEPLGITWGEKTHHTGVLVEGRLVAHAGWVASMVTSSTGESLEVCGLGGVIVHRDHRGSGIGHRLVTWTTARMQEEGRTVALLFCLPDRLSLYEGLGWRSVSDRVTVGQPDGMLEMPLRTCWIPLAEGATIPSGDLTVVGLPF